MMSDVADLISSKRMMMKIVLSSLALAVTAMADYKPTTLVQGAAAPEFSLVGVDGKTLKLADVRGEKATVVIFTTNHCPDAIASFGRMTALVDAFQSKGVGFVAINSNSPKGLHLAELAFTTLDDSYEAMKVIAKENEFNLPYLYDGETQEVAKSYGAVATPHAFIFDADLKLKYNGRLSDGRRKLGPAKKNEARDALTAILAGEDPEIIKTRPIGCSTKWLEKSGKVAQVDKQWAEQEVSVENVTADEVSKLVANKGGSEFRLINVWSLTCAPCIMEFPDLAKIYRQYSFHKFEFITLNVDDPTKDRAKVTDFLKEQELGIHRRIKAIVEKEKRTTNNFIFEGDTEDLAKALDPDWSGALPHTLLVDQTGKVIFRHTGVVDPEELKKAVVAEVWRIYGE
ncbi:redoxin domain-containing protein [Haloferula sp.]|uniref:redoxin domain-containing protein n=1 Tax=Haloferula sp. TaxID=2497595 RepID=UPI00329F2826